MNEDKAFLKTADNSFTIFLPELNETYHSKHGAIQESMHVFIENGLKLNLKENNRVLEFGFGTGLNALLTAIFADENKESIEYTSIEKFPLLTGEVEKLNYAASLAEKYDLQKEYVQDIFTKIHTSTWGEMVKISDNFSLKKIQSDFETIELKDRHYSACYFDVFSIRVQPELWSESIMRKIYESLQNNGLFITYACNATLKKNLSMVGFEYMKKNGPIGRRDMTIAWKK